MTSVPPTRRVAAGSVAACVGFLMLTSLALAQRPVISSCTATPSAVAPGGTALVRVRATSPAGLPLQYVYTPTSGTVAADGASATYTADASATGIVTILCEARDSHEGWVRSRTWIKVVAAGSAAPNPAQARFAAAPKSSPQPDKAVPPRTSPSSSASSSSAASSAAVAVVHAPPLPKPVPTAARPNAPPAPAAATQPAQPSKSMQPLKPAPQPSPSATLPSSAVVPHPELAPSASVLPQAGVVAAVPASPVGVPTGQSEAPQGGFIEYAVPSRMVAGSASQVTVSIHGHPADGGPSQATQYMKVLLMAENGAELHVVPAQDADTQMVPGKGTAKWAWSVTPGMAAANQRLHVRVYRESGGDAEQQVDYRSYTVDVAAPSALERAKRAYIDDADAWWKYWTPAGCVLVLLAALYARAVQRRKRAQARAAHKVYVSDWS